MENLYSSKDLFIIRHSLWRKNQKHAQNNHISLVAVLSRCFKMAISTRRYQWSQKWSTYTGWTVDRICYQLILSGYIDDQRILKFDWTRGTPSHIQPKVVFSSATWVNEKHTWHNLTKKDNLRCYISLMIISMQKNSDINWFFQETRSQITTIWLD